MSAPSENNASGYQVSYSPWLTSAPSTTVSIESTDPSVSQYEIKEPDVPPAPTAVTQNVKELNGALWLPSDYQAKTGWPIQIFVLNNSAVKFFSVADWAGHTGLIKEAICVHAKESLESDLNICGRRQAYVEITGAMTVAFRYLYVGGTADDGWRNKNVTSKMTWKLFST